MKNFIISTLDILLILLVGLAQSASSQVASTNNNSTQCDNPNDCQATCNECPAGLTDRLSEVESDLSFAKDTISINRLANSLALHMVDLESHYSNCLDGHTDAQGLLTNTTIDIYNFTADFVSDTLPGKVLLKHDSLKSRADKLVAYQEQLASRASTKRVFDNLEPFSIRITQLDTKSKQLGERIRQIRQRLSLIANNFESSERSQQADLIEIDDIFVRSLISRTERYVQDQKNASEQFQSIQGDLYARQVHMRDLRNQMSFLCQTNGHFLVIGRLFNLTKNFPSADSEVSCTNMVDKFDWLLSELHANIGQSYETMSMLTEFMQTMAESDKQELLFLQQKQNQQLPAPSNASNNDQDEYPIKRLQQLLALSQSRLVKLADQLNQTSRQIALVEFNNRSQELNLANLQLLTNLTTELKVKGHNMTNWLQTELQVQSRGLVDDIQAELTEYRNLTQREVFIDWTTSLGFAQSVDDLRDQLYHINETLPVNDDSLSKELTLARTYFISNKTLHQIEWAKLLKTNQTDNSGQDLASKLSTLRQLVSKASQDLSIQERAAAKFAHLVQHSREALQVIRVLEATNNNNNDSSPSLNELVDEANKLSDLIQSSKDVIGDKSNLFRIRHKHLLDNYDALEATSPTDKMDIRDYLVGNETGRPILQWAYEQFDQLKSVSESDLNVERVINITKFAQDDIKKSITSLSDKVARIRSILNDQTSFNRNFTPNSNNFGIWLKHPPELKDLCSTYTAISFYLKPMLPKQNGVIIYIGNNQTDSRSEFMAIELRHGKLVLVSNLGSSLVDEILDSNQITNNRWHLISVTRVGLLATISVSTNKLGSSVTRSLTSPHTVLNFDQTKASVIMVAGLPQHLTQDGKQPKGLHSNTGFSGRIDGLHLNGHRLGLWNTVNNFGTPIGLEEIQQTNHSRVMAPKWPSLSDSQLGQLRQQASMSDPLSLTAAQVASQTVGRLISFSKPKSNISSSFVQFLNMDYDELIDLDQTSSDPDGYLSGGGYIRRLTIRFRTEQANSLLLHHSRPDHSTFMSIYITAGRLMVAINFDKKLRVESHVPLDDGQWHTLHINIIRNNLAQGGPPVAELSSTSNTVRNRNHQLGQQEPTTRGKLVKHNISIIIDDKFLFRNSLIAQMDSSGSDARLGLRKRHVHRGDQSNEQNDSSWSSLSTSRQNNDLARAQRSRLFGTGSPTSARSWDESQLRKVLYFGGVEDKYIPLLRNQQIPTNFHGCISDVTVNDIHINFEEATKNQGARIEPECRQSDT